MKPEQFIKTIYLHDRACKKIEIDGWKRIVKIQIDEISRIRNPSGEWSFYNEENIIDGYIVFTDVRSFVFDPPGFIPNDEIEIRSVECISGDLYRYVFDLASCVEEGDYYMKLAVEAKGIHLEDPKKPGVKICD